MKLLPLIFTTQYSHMLLFLSSFWGIIHSARAQNIPDANFAQAIRDVCPTCIDGSNNLLPPAASITNLNIENKGIVSLSGLHGFSSLQTLWAVDNQVTVLPTLPNSLTLLGMRGNLLTSVSTLPTGLMTLDVDQNPVTSLPTLPAGLKYLWVQGGALTSLPALPSSLEWLYCRGNQLTSLPSLPASLLRLDCYNNQITSLPTLPSGLTELGCQLNQLTQLPTLPSNLTKLFCGENQLTQLPTLPNTLTELSCVATSITSLPTLPSTLTKLYIDNESIICLPNSVIGLQVYNRWNTPITTPPVCGAGIHIPDANFAQAIRDVCPTCIDGSNNLLPPAASINTLEIMSKNITDLTGIHGFTSLFRLDCRHNQLTTLPPLPASTGQIIAANNLLTSLPTLPTNLYELIVANNQLTSLPTLPNTLSNLTIDPDKITCLPNQVEGLTVYRYPADATFEEIPTPPTCIHIPDANFAAAIRAVCLNCINAADILLPPAASLTNLNIANKNISSLEGLHGFSALQFLICGQNQLTSLPNLPTTLTFLDCGFNQLTNLPTLPNSLTHLECIANDITALPDLPSGLTFLGFIDNQITSLPTLPSTLTTLNSGINPITALPELPNGLTRLDCTGNPLGSLPSLPSTLVYLYSSINNLSSLPALPNSLTTLWCTGNQLTTLPTLPSSLVSLQCQSNQITSLPTLPNSLTELYIDADKIICLPNSVAGLQVYNASNNPIPTPPVCASCDPPTGLQWQNTTATSTQPYWQAEIGKSYKVRWRAINAPNWIESAVLTPTNSGFYAYTITGLTNGSTYEWQVQSICNNVGGDFSPSIVFSTFCQPGNLGTPLPLATSATLNWGDLGVPLTFNLRWRIVGITKWNVANGITATTHQLTNLTPASNYEVQIQTVCGDGSTSGFSTSTTFTTLPCLTPTSATSNSPVCAGQTVQLTASGGGSYQWNCPGGNCPEGFNATSPTPSFVGSTANDGTYSVTITTPEGCTSKSNVVVLVRPIPNATVSSNSPVCIGGTIRLQAGGGTTYTWSCPNGNCDFDASLRNPNFMATSISQSGNYAVTIGNTYGCTTSTSVAVTINELPNASISSNSPVCVGGTIQLSASGGNTYQWKGPGGFTSTESNPTRIAAANLGGNYTVTTVNESGCATTSTVNVEVYNLSPIPVTSNSPVCNGEIVNLTASGGSSYQWNCPDGNCPEGFNATSATPSFVGTTSNDGIYSVTIVTPEGCITKSNVSVVVRPRPTATASSNGPVCVGTSLRLQASGGTTYAWSCPSGNCDFDTSLRNPSFSPTSSLQSGNYTVTVANTYGCTASASVAVTINPLPNISVSSNSPVCVGETIYLNASGGNTYQWKGPKAFTSTEANPTRVAATNVAGIYTVTVSNDFCSATGTVNIEVNTLPTADITTSTGKTVICGEIALILNVPAQNGATYQWKKDNVPVENSSNILSVNSIGTYSVEVTNELGCKSIGNITLTAQPALSATATHSIAQVQGVQTLKLTANPAGLKYNWSGPSNFSSTQRNPSISPVSNSNAGTYNLIVTETLTGCTASATTVVILGGAARIAVSEEEISSEEAIQMTISPNPTFGKMSVEIRLKTASTLQMNWINMSGKNIQEWKSDTVSNLHQFQLDVSAYAEGIYLLRAETMNGKSRTLKVMKKDY